MKSFRALSALLSYPAEELKEAIPDIRRILAEEDVVSRKALVALEPLLQLLESTDVLAAQENYVLLFDRSRSLSLNLFEHVHGESRDRGGAMVDLLQMYQDSGFELVGSELPDHLPVLLEYLSTRDKTEARTILADAGAILAALADRLARRETPYAGVLAALAEFADARSTTEQAAALMAEPLDNPLDLAALDATYAEAQVVFGPDPNAGCPAARDVLNRMAQAPAAAE